MNQKNLEELVTKKDLDDQISALETRTDIKFDKLERRIDEKARKYRDEVLTVMDSLANQLKTLHQEMVMINKHSADMWVKINNHETRITKLEKVSRHN